MTREIIEDFRFIVIPYMVNRLKEINYEGQGGSDAKEFMSDFNEICDMAIKALGQEPKKGHWIETAEEYYKAINEKGGGVNEDTDYFTDDIACSECLAKFSVIDNEAERFDFCPCCGSDNR